MTDFFENLLNNGELQEKVAELQGKIDAYQMSENEANEIITELKALIAQRDESITAQAEIILELKADNERLKQEWRLDCLKCEYKNTKADVNKYKQTLQEIKTIADTRFVNGLNKEADIYNAQMGKILGLITKAEEE